MKVGVQVRNLEHDGTLLLRIDGDVCARHPGVGAQVPQPHVGVPGSVGKAPTLHS